MTGGCRLTHELIESFRGVHTTQPNQVHVQCRLIAAVTMATVAPAHATQIKMRRVGPPMNSQAERNVACGDWDCHPRLVGRISTFRYRLHVQGVLHVFHLIHVCLDEKGIFLAQQQYIPSMERMSA